MSVTALRRPDREALFPEGPEGDFQEAIGPFQRIDSRQTHFFHQPVLQRAEQPLDASLGLRRMGRDPLDVQFRQRAAELRARRGVLQLLVPLCAPRGHKQAVFIGVQRQRPPVSLQPAAQRAQIFLGRIVLH